jgi:hypothetical protein
MMMRLPSQPPQRRVASRRRGRCSCLRARWRRETAQRTRYASTPSTCACARACVCATVLRLARRGVHDSPARRRWEMRRVADARVLFDEVRACTGGGGVPRHRARAHAGDGLWGGGGARARRVAARLLRARVAGRGYAPHRAHRRRGPVPHARARAPPPLLLPQIARRGRRRAWMRCGRGAPQRASAHTRCRRGPPTTERRRRGPPRRSRWRRAPRSSRRLRLRPTRRGSVRACAGVRCVRSVCVTLTVWH